MAPTEQLTKETKLYSMNSNPVMLFRIHAVVDDCSDSETPNDEAKVIVYSHDDRDVPQFARPAAEFYRDFTEVKP